MDASTLPSFVADVQPVATTVPPPVKAQGKEQSGKGPKTAGGFAGIFSEAVSTSNDQPTDKTSTSDEISQQFNLFGLLPLLAVTPQVSGTIASPTTNLVVGDTAVNAISGTVASTGVNSGVIANVTTADLSLINQANPQAKATTNTLDAVQSLIDAALPQAAGNSATTQSKTADEVSNILLSTTGQQTEKQTKVIMPNQVLVANNNSAGVDVTPVIGLNSSPAASSVPDASAKPDAGTGVTNTPATSSSGKQVVVQVSQFPLADGVTRPLAVKDSDVPDGLTRTDLDPTVATVQPAAKKDGGDNLLQFSLNTGKNSDLGKDSATPNDLNQSTLSFAATLNHQVTSTQPHTNVASSATPQSAVADPNNVIGQIIDNARLINRAQTSEMVIKLKPEHLGELTLKIAVDNGGVTATFHSTNADVRGVIEASLPQLKQDMASQGLKVNYVGVYTSLDQSTANDHQRNFDQQQLKSAKSRRSVDFIEAVEEATAAAPNVAASGVDYRI
jgi:flagellar hook-length control protein FliK